MRLQTSMWQFLVFLSTALAAVTVDSSNYNINRPSNVTSITCGEIVNKNQDAYQIWFFAADVIDCLTSLPFLPDVGTRFIRWYNDTLQYHVTTAYLRTPPSSYQQPRVDLFAGLQSIQNRINSGYYKNQYAFEADVQALTQKSHDSHLTLWGGALPTFSFSSPVYISTVSIDGKQVPKTYVSEDLKSCGQGACKYSAIKTINGVATTDYLTAYAKENSFGYVEGHADWQNLVYTPAQDVVNGFNAFTGFGTFYPGDDLKLAFENGTTLNYRWIASYNSPGFTGPLATAGDFYNFFVLGLEPANFNETYQAYLATHGTDNDTTTDTNTTTTKLTSWTADVPAYPATMSHQEDLGLTTSGYLTGYYLDDVKTAVLSIPSFEAWGNGIDTFSQAVVDFINNATDRNAEKVIIDLQQNLGGQVSIALDTFRLFFPNNVPYTGSRRRSWKNANLLGDATTRYFNSLNTSTDEYFNAVTSEWVATDLINANTRKNFTSWSQLYGPYRYNNDNFSAVQKYNLSSPVFSEAFLNIVWPDCYYTGTCDLQAPWKAKDIVILTDGLCTSACSVFVELMTRDAGVRTIAVGGRPQTGPMQAASGSRGAASYARSYVDTDIAYIAQYNKTINSTLPKSGDSGMDVTWAGFTLRDQIRPNSTVPNQFLYIPADCRIYWSLANFNNYTQLWRDTYSGAFGNGSICVSGSTNVKTPPKPLSARSAELEKRGGSSVASFIADAIGATTHETIQLDHDGVQDGPPQISGGDGSTLTFCQDSQGKKKSSLCPAGRTCRLVEFPCLKDVLSGSCQAGKCQGTESDVDRFVCQKGCFVGKPSKPQCGAAFDCIPVSAASGNARTPTDQSAPTSQQKLFDGFCVPFTGATLKKPKLCNAISTNAQLQALVKNRQ